MIPADNLEYPRYIHEAATEWFLLIESGDLTAEEKTEFESWRKADPRHADAYDQAVTMWSALATLEKSDLQPALFKRSEQKRSQPHFGEWSIWAGRARGGVLGLAALAIAALAGISGLVQLSSSPVIIETEPPQWTAYRTEIGQSKNVTLSDNTVVTIGAGSEVEVSMRPSERRVRLLRGAAVFDVERDIDRPFFVEANDLTVRVLGTAFDVRNNGGIVRLSVKEGRVEVSHPFMVGTSATSLINRKELKPGARISATQTDGLGLIESFKLKDFASWRGGRLSYADATLHELIADANRYSDRKIVLSDSIGEIGQQTATLSFEGSDVGRLLQTLPAIYAVEVEDDGDGTIIVGRK
ncbi:MAG: FecR domain-containing protein [Pseudomonadota bacterium]